MALPAAAMKDKDSETYADTAVGLIYGGTGKMFPRSMTLAQTWNQDEAFLRQGAERLIEILELCSAGYRK